MPLQIRRGTTAQRLAITPLPGEPIFDTTLNQLFVGDGITAGGQSPSTSLLVSEITEQAIDSVGQALVNGVHQNIIFTYGTVQDNLDRIDAAIDLSNYNGEIAAFGFKGSIIADNNDVIINSSNKNINANSVTAISIDTDSLNITSGSLQSDLTGNVTGDIIGSVFADDSTLLVDATNGAINFNGTVKGDIVPDGDELYDIGSPTNKFRDLYLSGTSLNLGSAQITAVGSAIELPAGSTIDGIPIGTGTGSGTGDGVIEGSTYKINIAADDSSIMIDTDLETVTASGGFFGDVNANIISTQFIDGDNSSEIEVRTSLRVKGDLVVENEIFTPIRIITNEIQPFPGSPIFFKGDIVPDGDELYDIGSPTNKFRDLYLSGTSLNLGSAQITAIGSAIELPAGSTIDGIPIGTGSETGTGDGVIEGSTYKINIAADDSSIMLDTDLQTVTASGGFFGDVNANIISTQFIDGDNSSEVEVRTSFRVNSDLIVENEIFAPIRIITNEIQPFPGGSINLNSEIRVKDLLAIQNNLDNNNSVFSLIKHTSNNFGSRMTMFRSRGTESLPSAVSQNDILSVMSSGGYDGSGYVTGASITVTVQDSISPGIVPSAISFSTMNNAGVLKPVLILDNNNVATIGFDSTDAGLHILTGYSAQRSKGILFSQHHNNADATRFNFVRTRGSINNQQAVQNGDRLASLLFLGHDGTDPTGITGQKVGGVFYIEVDGAVTQNNVPSKFVWRLNDGTAPPTGSSSAPIQAEILNTSTLKINNLSSLTTNTSINFSTMAKLVSYADETAANNSVGGSPSAGMIYYDTGASKAKVYDGSVWQVLW